MFSLFRISDDTLDINIHDTYYVIAHSHLQLMNCFILFTFFSIYWSLDKLRLQTIRILSNMHIYVTCLTVSGIYYPYIFLFPIFFEDSMNLLIAILGLLLVAVQIVFVINIGIGIFRMIPKKSS